MTTVHEQNLRLKGCTSMEVRIELTIGKSWIRENIGGRAVSEAI